MPRLTLLSRLRLALRKTEEWLEAAIGSPAVWENRTLNADGATVAYQVRPLHPAAWVGFARVRLLGDNCGAARFGGVSVAPASPEIDAISLSAAAEYIEEIADEIEAELAIANP